MCNKYIYFGLMWFEMINYTMLFRFNFIIIEVKLLNFNCNYKLMEPVNVFQYISFQDKTDKYKIVWRLERLFLL